MLYYDPVTSITTLPACCVTCTMYVQYKYYLLLSTWNCMFPHLASSTIHFNLSEMRLEIAVELSFGRSVQKLLVKPPPKEIPLKERL